MVRLWAAGTWRCSFVGMGGLKTKLKRVALSSILAMSVHSMVDEEKWLSFLRAVIINSWGCGMGRVKPIFQIIALIWYLTKFPYSYFLIWRYSQCRLLDPSNHLCINTCAFQAEEDQKNQSRMQTLMDSLQLKVQSYKQQIEAVVKCLERLRPYGFPSRCFWLIEMCGQLVRENQLSLNLLILWFFSS